MSNPSPSQVQQAESGGPCASLDSVKCILTHGGGPSWNRRCTNSTPVHGACQITSPLINLISESGGHLGFKSPESTPHFHSLVCRNRSQGTKRYTRQMLITQPPEQSVAGRGRKRRKGVGGGHSNTSQALLWSASSYGAENMPEHTRLLHSPQTRPGWAILRNILKPSNEVLC